MLVARAAVLPGEAVLLRLHKARIEEQFLQCRVPYPASTRSFTRVISLLGSPDVLGEGVWELWSVVRTFLLDREGLLASVELLEL